MQKIILALSLALVLSGCGVSTCSVDYVYPTITVNSLTLSNGQPVSAAEITVTQPSADTPLSRTFTCNGKCSLTNLNIYQNFPLLLTVKADGAKTLTREVKLNPEVYSNSFGCGVYKVDYGTYAMDLILTPDAS